LNLDRNLGKTNPLNENDLAEFIELQKTKADSPNSWSIDVSQWLTSSKSPMSPESQTYDLSVKNPNKKEEAALRQTKDIVEEMKALDEESAEILNSILELI
jgi:type I restriction enzyme M protein